MSSTRSIQTPRASTVGTLKQRAYAELKALILSDELAAGSVQSVRQLAARLEMSKTPVYAAIERLEAEGLVTLAPQQGVVVRKFSIHDIADNYEIRQALETHVMRRLAGQLTSSQIAILTNSVENLRRAADHEDNAAFVSDDAEFHRLLAGFVGNEEILRVMRQLQDKMQRVIFRVTTHFPERVEATCAEHQAIVDCLVSGDGDLAAQRMHEHLERGLTKLLSRQ